MFRSPRCYSTSIDAPTTTTPSNTITTTPSNSITTTHHAAAVPFPTTA